MSLLGLSRGITGIPVISKQSRLKYCCVASRDTMLSYRSFSKCEMLSSSWFTLSLSDLISFFVFANPAVKASNLLETNNCDVSRLLSFLSRSRILLSNHSVTNLACLAISVFSSVNKSFLKVGMSSLIHSSLKRFTKSGCSVILAIARSLSPRSRQVSIMIAISELLQYQLID